MSDADLQDETGPTGTQEFHPEMHGTSGHDGGLIWDPISKTYQVRVQQRQPLRTQVPGMPSPETFQEKTQNPQFEGVFAKTAAVRLVQLGEDDFGVYSDHARGPYNTPLVFRGTFDECRAWIKNEGRYASTIVYASDDTLAQAQQYRDTANHFEAQAGNAPNVARRDWLLEKANYYRTLADQVSPSDAQNSAPDAQSLGDVYQDVVPKRNPGMTDDTFPSSISHHTPKVSNMSFDIHSRISLGNEDANLRDCPSDCGGLMGDHDGESVCHNCGHKEKIHYAQTAGFLAPLIAPAAEALGGGAVADAVGGGAMTNVLRAGNLMSRVMGGGAGEAAGGMVGGETSAPGSAEADSNMVTGATDMYGDEMVDTEKVDPNAPWDGTPSWGYSGDPYVDLGVAEEKLHFGQITQAEYDALLQRAQISRPEDYPDDESNPMYAQGKTASGVDEDTDGFASGNSGHDSEPDSGNKGSEGQDTAADELDSDNDGDAGGSQGMRGLDLFTVFEPHLESIADNDDSSDDPIAKLVHELLERDHPGYLDKAARYEISKIAGGSCPTCAAQLDGLTQCKGPANINCPVGLSHPMGVNQNPASMGQPVQQGGTAVASVTKEAKPKMCPVHEQMVNYALTLQDPAAAVQALSGQLFGEHSCQGGWMGENRNGNPIKCKYKPEMITQGYWDEKEQQAEQRKLEREQQQALIEQQLAPQPVVEAEPEGQLVGGPAFEEQIQQVEEKQPVTQDIPDTSGLQAEQDYIPAEQGGTLHHLPTPQERDPNYRSETPMPVAASFKWSGPPSMGPEQMFADTPPEELPSDDAGLISEGPTDTDGNPIEVGQTYEVTSSNADDYVPDRYTITGVDPNGNFLQFEVEPQPGQPFGFTSTLSTQQIQAQGLNFAPASDAANARGEVETDQDNTKGSDDPTGVTDLDTGGNSHASKTAVIDFSEGYGMENEPPYGTPRVDQGENDVHWMDESRADHGHDEKAELGPLVRLRDMMVEQGYDEKEINAILNAYWAEQRADQGRAQLANPTGEEYGLDDEDMAGMQIEHAAKMEGNPNADWLKEDTPVELQAKTAGRDFSLGEQRGFVNEMGSARNLDKLDLSGTHYPTETDDPYADALLW